MRCGLCSVRGEREWAAERNGAQTGGIEWGEILYSLAQAVHAVKVFLAKDDLYGVHGVQPRDDFCPFRVERERESTFAPEFKDVSALSL